MSTGGSTCRSSDASGKPPLTYRPGSKVEHTTVSKKRPRVRACAPALPPDVINKILEALVDLRAGDSVILMSMVNSALRQQVGASHQLWYRLYLHWRGPLARSDPAGIRRVYGVPMGILTGRPTMVPLLPTTPRTLPNFKIRTLSMR
jgi:hypothetical protein